MFDDGDVDLNLDGKWSAHRTVIAPVAIIDPIPEGAFLVARWHQDRTSSAGGSTKSWHLLAIDDVSFATGATRILSFAQFSPIELELVFFPPFVNYTHAVEHAGDLVSSQWDNQQNTTVTPLGDNVFQAVFPMGNGDCGFYRVTSSARQPLPVTVHVKDFGAVPDDGECDVSGITDAIAAISDRWVRVFRLGRDRRGHFLSF